MILRSRWINAIDGIAAAVSVQIESALKADRVLGDPYSLRGVKVAMTAQNHARTVVGHVAPLCAEAECDNWSIYSSLIGMAERIPVVA